MILNSLNMDPQRVWQHPWRWYDEKMLHNCLQKGLDTDGITMEEFAHI